MDPSDEDAHGSSDVDSNASNAHHGILMMMMLQRAREERFRRIRKQ